MVDYRFFCNTAICLVVVNCVVLVLLMELPMLSKFAPIMERIRVYENARDNILQDERYDRIGGKMILCEAEQQANLQLMALKNREVSGGLYNLSSLQPAHSLFPIENYVNIHQTPVFAMLQTMPKGAALHVYDLALCSNEYLVQLTYRPNLWVCISPKDGRYKRLRFALQEPLSTDGKALEYTACHWKLLKALRDKIGADVVDRQLYKQFTLQPHQRYDNALAIRQQFHQTLNFISGLVTYVEVWKDFIHQGLNEFYADGVQYVEIRSSLPNLYDLNGTNYTIVNTTELMYAAELTFREKYPDWIGSKMIYAPSRNVDDTRYLQFLGNALILKSTFPEYFAGFDLVGYENAGRPLRDFAHQLIAVQSQLNFYFHADETNWYGPNTDENILDAVLLGTKRIGNALTLYKHPELMSLVRSNHIAIEINPISHQVLQLLSDDLRYHPAAYFFSRDYPVVISSGYPALWKAAPLTHDYYVTFMGIAPFDTNLAMLKQLAFHSLKFGTFTDDARNAAILKWIHRWGQWVKEVTELRKDE